MHQFDFEVIFEGSLKLWSFGNRVLVKTLIKSVIGNLTVLKNPNRDSSIKPDSRGITGT